jgi:hypothetical protein
MNGDYLLKYGYFHVGGNKIFYYLCTRKGINSSKNTNFIPDTI